MAEILFECTIPVSRHSSKKNEKAARFNRKKGHFFIGQTSKAKHCETWLLQRLQIEKLKRRIDTIDCDINAKFIFCFPKSVYFTKAGPRSRKLPDQSNLYELPQDALQKVGIISNDTLIVSHDGSRRMPIDGTQYLLKIELSLANHDRES